MHLIKIIILSYKNNIQGHFNLSTLIIRKGSIFPKNHKREKLYNFEGKLVTLKAFYKALPKMIRPMAKIS